MSAALSPRGWMVGVGVAVLLSGCADRPGGLGIGYAERNSYACQPASQALPTGARAFNFYPGSGPSFDAYYNAPMNQVVLAFTHATPRHLSEVPGGAGVLYADNAFAWNDQGTVGILTDKQYALVYACRKLA